MKGSSFYSWKAGSEDLNTMVATKPRFNLGGWVAETSSDSVIGWGMCAGIINGSSTSSSNKNANGRFLLQSTAAIADSNAYVDSQAEGGSLDITMNWTVVIMAELGQITNQRVVIGCTDQEFNSVVLNSDDPSGNHLFFQQRNVDEESVDVNWFFCSKNGSLMSRYDTGVPVSEDARLFVIRSDGTGSTVFWSIFETSGHLIKTGFIANNLPSTGISLHPASGISNRGDVKREIKQYRCNIFTG